MYLTVSSRSVIRRYFPCALALAFGLELEVDLALEVGAIGEDESAVKRDELQMLRCTRTQETRFKGGELVSRDACLYAFFSPSFPGSPT